MKTFPVYKSHDNVGCFNCGADLYGEHYRSNEYPTGRFDVTCPKCEHTTFYDLEERS